MSSTPYFDAYEKYRASKNKFNLTIKKKFIQTFNGEYLLKDIEFYDGEGNMLNTLDNIKTR